MDETSMRTKHTTVNSFLCWFNEFDILDQVEREFAAFHQFAAAGTGGLDDVPVVEVVVEAEKIILLRAAF